MSQSFIFQALLPLVNVPLISYALEILNRNGVEEVWIFSATFVDKIKEFVKYEIHSKFVKFRRDKISFHFLERELSNT